MDKNIFFKYNNKEIRKKIKTDFYIEQNEKNIEYNIEKIIKNFIKEIK